MIVAFTGHRPDKLGGYYEPNPIKKSIKYRLGIALKYVKPSKCISGMAVGFDQWAAEVCIQMKIPFIAAVPFEGQEKLWPYESQQNYKKLLAEAEEVKFICPPGFSRQKMILRNYWMVDNADMIVAVFDGSPGGTANCIKYAEKKNKPVFKIEL